MHVLLVVLCRCEWKYAGVKISEATGRPLEVSALTWKPAGDYYERFTHTASNQVWLLSPILTHQPWPSESAQHVALQ